MDAAACVHAIHTCALSPLCMPFSSCSSAGVDAAHKVRPCLPACLPAFLPACLPARLPARLPAYLPML